MSLLTPEPGLVFWMTLSFGIVAFILIKYGFPIILQMVNKRKDYIDNSLLAARQANEELAKVTENSQAILEQTRIEQAKMLEVAAQTRDRMIEEAKGLARTEADKIVADAQKQIIIEKENAMRAIRSEIASLSISVAEKILREKLNTEEEQSKMINRLMDEVMISKS
ncbi:MAG: F0F1 ATP synthase subunit B [Petrimonas sp.]|uniref:F0F1 ATP synthase subunit B n=1 Tax=Petrimonas sp. TaxID=2023866 RepID=UPI00095BE2EA|nr:F0F1 ATP synthase subunit B [Petrimonas sp.]MEA5063854.1 F0F1 ATP synthase subunit B [Petrimonas sp.]OJV33095.1 MAG: ATP synthase F0 subunit B [Bacteroidia bacterium 43-41]